MAGAQPESYAPELVFRCFHTFPPQGPALRKRVGAASPSSAESRAMSPHRHSRAAPVQQARRGGKRSGSQTLFPGHTGNGTGKSRDPFKPVFPRHGVKAKRQGRSKITLKQSSLRRDQAGAGGQGSVEDRSFGARLLVPRYQEDGVMFDAPFTEERYMLVRSNSRQRELEGVVDDLFDSQVMQDPEEGIFMLQRWLKALYDGGIRAISHIRNDRGEPPLPASEAMALGFPDPNAGGSIPSPASHGIPLGSWKSRSNITQDGLLNCDAVAMQIAGGAGYDSVKVESHQVSLAMHPLPASGAVSSGASTVPHELHPVFGSMLQILKDAVDCQDDGQEGAASSGGVQGGGGTGLDVQDSCQAERH